MGSLRSSEYSSAVVILCECDGFVNAPKTSLVTTFDQPFLLTIRHAALPSGETVAPSLYYWNAATGDWESILASHNATTRTLTAMLDHLTEFAVMQKSYRIFLPSVTDE